mmetsp:Transcript_34754/g.75535  ORF Transcript_34754/g.75535 Transcript_34754/m.75535 type:complete len:223 (+) Transcript_34754:249-917(+)
MRGRRTQASCQAADPRHDPVTHLQRGGPEVSRSCDIRKPAAGPRQVSSIAAWSHCRQELCDNDKQDGVRHLEERGAQAAKGPGCKGRRLSGASPSQVAGCCARKQGRRGSRANGHGMAKPCAVRRHTEERRWRRGGAAAEVVAEGEACQVAWPRIRSCDPSDGRRKLHMPTASALQELHGWAAPPRLEGREGSAQSLAFPTGIACCGWCPGVQRSEGAPGLR